MCLPSKIRLPRENKETLFILWIMNNVRNDSNWTEFDNCASSLEWLTWYWARMISNRLLLFILSVSNGFHHSIFSSLIAVLFFSVICYSYASYVILGGLSIDSYFSLIKLFIVGFILSGFLNDSILNQCVVFSNKEINHLPLCVFILSWWFEKIKSLTKTEFLSSITYHIDERVNYQAERGKVSDRIIWLIKLFFSLRLAIIFVHTFKISNRSSPPEPLQHSFIKSARTNRELILLIEYESKTKKKEDGKIKQKQNTDKLKA